MGAAVLLRQLFLLIIPVIFLWMIVAGRDRLKSVLYLNHRLLRGSYSYDLTIYCL